jgi:hypothetical protein
VGKIINWLMLKEVDIGNTGITLC